MSNRRKPSKDHLNDGFPRYFFDDLPVLNGSSNVSLRSNGVTSSPYPTMARPSKSISSLSSQLDRDMFLDADKELKETRSVSANLPAPSPLFTAGGTFPNSSSSTSLNFTTSPSLRKQPQQQQQYQQQQPLDLYSTSPNSFLSNSHATHPSLSSISYSSFVSTLDPAGSSPNNQDHWNVARFPSNSSPSNPSNFTPSFNSSRTMTQSTPKFSHSMFSPDLRNQSSFSTFDPAANRSPHIDSSAPKPSSSSSSSSNINACASSSQKDTQNTSTPKLAAINTSTLPAQSPHPAALSPSTHVSSRSRNTSGQHVVYPNPFLSVYWRANDPTEWTMERVIYWLEYNKFGPDWVDTFRSRNIHGEEFLSLVSYQKLKSLGNLSTSNDVYDTRHARFIHILRKVLDKSNSNTSNSMFGPDDDNVDHFRSHSYPENDAYVNDEQAITTTTSNILRPMRSEYTLGNQYSSDTFSRSPVINSSKMPFRNRSFKDLHEIDPARIRIRPYNKMKESRELLRPTSTYETGNNKHQVSPTSPSSFTHFFSKKHTKSSSSESSLTGVNALQKTISHIEERVKMEESKKSSSFLGKLRRKDKDKDRSNSRDCLHPSRSASNLLESPVSPAMSFLPDAGLPVHKSHFPTIDPKFCPIKLDQPKFILVTSNNETFTTVNISEASTLEEAKVLIGNKLNIQDWALCTFHLTEFGYKEGQSLDDGTFQQLLFSTQKFAAMGDILKIYVNYVSEPEYDASTSPGSLSLEYVFATNTRRYPATPGYMINQDSVDPKGQVPPPKSNDYFSSKSVELKNQSTFSKPNDTTKPKLHNTSSQSPMIPQQQFNKWQDYKMGPHPSTKSSRDNINNSIVSEDQGLLLHPGRPSAGSMHEPSMRRSSEDSFKVIRNDRKEINFDDRRSSPYDRRPSYNPRQPSISIQTGTLTTNAAAALQKRNNLAGTQQSTHIQDTPQLDAVVPDPQTLKSAQDTQLSRGSSQSSRKSNKLERTPSQLVALRSAPPPPPGGSGLQRANSRNGAGQSILQTFSPGKFDPGPSAGNNITLPRMKHPGVTDSTASFGRQFSFKQEAKSKRISTGPPRIDLGDFHSPGLSAELGLGLDDFQSDSFSDILTNAASSTSKTSPVVSSSTPTPQKQGTIQDEKFFENEISFENAPAFEDSDDDSSSSDEGLWAKKPPAPPSETIDLTGTSDKPKKKPQLHVEIVTPHIHGTDDGHFGNASASPLVANKSGSYLDDIKLGGWAVRPPAEVVYENLERFFPDADLDRPILIDPQGNSPPTSPSNEIIAGKFSNRPPLSPVPEPPKDSTKLQEVQTPYIGSFQDGKNLAVPPSPISSGTNMKQESVPRARTQEIIYTPNNTEETPPPPPPPPVQHPNLIGNKVGLKMRTKSLRIVVQEATERRKRFQTLASANNKGGSGALLRRKSTKMWGQKVVEVKPSEMKRGQLSRLQDNRGKVKQFVWVKGELIGKGSFGKVYLALNATAGEMIAVKQVEVPQTLSDKSNSKQKEVIDTLHAEVETMKDLDHFNIVQYLGFEALPDFYNLFLEYVPGGSVGSALRQHGRFEESVIKSFTRQVLDALSYLHSCGILHRDLKSDNLLIDLDGVCKISDFGISKKSRDIYTNDAEMSMQGTIFWMAPEVIHNVVHNAKQGYSAKVDIWSLGCVVLEMFAGRRPWSTDEAIGAMYKLGNARLAPPIPEDTVPFVSKDGKDIIDQCFQINPDKRPTASELFAHPFCEIPKNYRFQDTKLAKMIKVNDKRVGK